MAVLGAGVELVTGTRVSRATTTDRDGRFTFAAVPAGEVGITVSLDGFRTVQQTVMARIGTVVQVPIVLPIAGSPTR